MLPPLNGHPASFYTSRVSIEKEENVIRGIVLDKKSQHRLVNYLV